MVLLIAAIAAGSLWVLLKMYNRSIRASATLSVMNIGRHIALHLADQPFVNDPDSESWTGFSELINALHKVEGGLMFVSVTKGGATVFHEQLISGDTENASIDHMFDDTDLTVGRRLIVDGTGSVPVMTFTLSPSSEAEFETIQIGIRRDAVDREGMLPTIAVGSMFKVAVLTIALSFGISLIILVIMLKREASQEGRRRREEHLAFAGVMANGIVHDFRNPMSSLKLDAQMLNKITAKADTPESKRVGELSTRIAGTLDRMDKVFQEFLYLSQPHHRAGVECDLRDIIKDCVEFMGPKLERAKLKIEIKMEDTPHTVIASPASLGRAIINLVTNAEQFSPPVSVIELKSFVSGSSVILDIKDHGPGIPDSERARIFEMFFTNRPGGTGMGLFLARTAIEEYGGKIVLQDSSSKGAWFRVTMPLLVPKAKEKR
ncbi:MAG: HAMP domain-containing histidine kinase [Lentisphaerae bacterium]|nr:HAMP domain-containing histidine kinase [Lentisphaerota bacterium]